jgi:hypothetical protein
VSTAQQLLRRLLEQAGDATESSYLLVLDGEGLEDLPERMPTARGELAVVRVGTEIRLRHLLWKAQRAPLIAVLPEELAQRIQKSPDLLRRARNQRVHALAANDVLEAVLGVRVIGAETEWLQQLAVEHVEQLGVAMTRRTLPTVIDRRLLTEMLVDASVGEEVRSRTPAQLLAAWLRSPPRWSPNVIRLVCDALPRLHADEGRLLAWAIAEPEQRLRALLVHGAVLTVDADEVPRAAWGPLWAAARESPIEMDHRILRRTAASLATDALGELQDAAADLLTEADRVGRQTLTPSVLQTSRVLPLAFADRCLSLAKSAAAGKAVSAADVAWLERHLAAGTRRPDLAVLAAMARLSRYLDEPPVARTEVVEQVRDYQRHGAFADLAVLHLQRALAASAHYHDQARGLLAAVRERRNRENERFAETLAGGYERALHAEGLTPLHRIWKRTVARLWADQPNARLYLVVLDGCSYPLFLELLLALAQGSHPIGVHPDEEGLVRGLPALSPLPTITSHARGAVFLGELPHDPLVAETVFRDQDEAKTDRARFAQNAALGDRSRRLFLKSDLADGGQALCAALRDESLAVVAAVFNAVDELIGSSATGAALELAPDRISGFTPSLQEALAAGRRVLVTADHGHTTFIDKGLRAGSGKAARYVSLGAGDPVPDGFIELDLAALGGPPERRAFAWQSGVYFGNPQVGFHGGCSLEEMVVPLAWLEPRGLQADEPAWWFGRGILPESPEPPRPITPPLRTPPPSDVSRRPAGGQVDLFDPASRAARLPLPEEVRAGLSRDEVTVLVLLQENGSARASELAARLKKNPGRLSGLMHALRRTLHAAGRELFSAQTLPNGETMYRYEHREED